MGGVRRKSLRTLWFILNLTLAIENTFNQTATRGCWLAYFWFNAPAFSPDGGVVERQDPVRYWAEPGNLGRHEPETYAAGSNGGQLPI